MAHRRRARLHVPFGTVLAADGRPFKTRSGGSVRLGDLLDAAVDQARAAIADKDHGLDPDELEHEAADIGAVKYADLSTSRTEDYTFYVERLVALNGNTGVYLQERVRPDPVHLRKLPSAGTPPTSTAHCRYTPPSAVAPAGVVWPVSPDLYEYSSNCSRLMGIFGGRCG